MKEVQYDVINEWLKQRILVENKNAIIIINGATGSGKTYAALEMARKAALSFGANFTIEDNVAFKFGELLKMTLKPINSKPGTPFVFEEVGAFGGGASSKQWQSQSNLFFSTFMQTNRHRNQIMIMTCPNYMNLAKDVRELCHMQCVMSGINKKKRYSSLRCYQLQMNCTSGIQYKKFPRLRVKNVRYKYTTHRCKLVPDDILIPYEKKKTDYTDTLYKKLIELDEKEKEIHKKQTKTLDSNTILRMKTDGLSNEVIGAYTGKSTRTVREVVRELRETGRLPSDFNDNTMKEHLKTLRNPRKANKQGRNGNSYLLNLPASQKTLE